MNAVQILQFQDIQFSITDINGQPWLRSPQIAEALGYSQTNRIVDVYNRNADEFTDAMTQVVELETAGGLQKVRIFSLRGCHLLGMLAKTEKAKEFRRWVLDVLDARTSPQAATAESNGLGFAISASQPAALRRSEFWRWVYEVDCHVSHRLAA